MVRDDSCFTYVSCLFPFLDLQIVFSLLFVPGFDKARRYMTCVGSFFFPSHISWGGGGNGKEVTVF